MKGKSDAIPAAIVRGTGRVRLDGGGAATLVRTGGEDWFGYGQAEAVRAALGTEPGSRRSSEVGIASSAPEALTARLSRAIAVALAATEDAGVDAGGQVLRVTAPTAYVLGLAVARLQVALWGEGLRVEVPDGTLVQDALEVTLAVGELRTDHAVHKAL